MAVEAVLTIDCDGNVALVVTNNTTQGFTGQYATASSWIGDASVAAGASRTITAHINGLNPTVAGYVRGKLDDGTPVSTTFSGTKEGTCAPYIPPTTVVDLTPKPVPTTTPGQTVVYCQVPGSNPPMSVPCDDPRATQPYQPPTTAPVVTTPVTEAPVASEAPVVVTGPPRTHQAVVHAAPATLPATGPVLLGPELAIAGLCAAIGAAFIRLTHRRANP
jgi:hypothetical protein